MCQLAGTKILHIRDLEDSKKKKPFLEMINIFNKVAEHKFKIQENNSFHNSLKKIPFSKPNKDMKDLYN